MFGRITKQQVSHHFNKAKNFLGSAYHHTKNFLGDVDKSVRTVKSIYGAVAPILESYGVNTNNKHLMKAVSGYDNIRHNVMENHDRVVNDINMFKNNLKHKNINFEIA